MSGRIESGQLVTVVPWTDYSVDDIVLCRVAGNQYLHLIKTIQSDRYQIGNNKGRINGWIDIGSIFGKCIEIQN